MQQSNYKIIISGGGTGGHILPAIAIANALKAINQRHDILFVGANGRMEMEKVPAAGFKIIGLNIAGLQRSFSLKNFLFPFKLISSLLQAKKIIKDFKPDAAVGVGGYASGPLLYMAASANVPCVIQEQNSYPGITNKLLANKASRICVAYQGMENYFPADKLMLSGNPVRQDLLNITNKSAEAFEYFGLDKNIKTILIVGGSLGARTINQSIQQSLDILFEAEVQVIWQTGKAFYDSAVDSARKYESKIKVHAFISKMDYAFSVADVIVWRAGASTIAELCIVKKVKGRLSLGILGNYSNTIYRLNYHSILTENISFIDTTEISISSAGSENVVIGNVGGKKITEQKGKVHGYQHRFSIIPMLQYNSLSRRKFQINHHLGLGIDILNISRNIIPTHDEQSFMAQQVTGMTLKPYLRVGTNLEYFITKDLQATFIMQWTYRNESYNFSSYSGKRSAIFPSIGLRLHFY